MTGYLCACGNALPSGTPCGCTADYDDPRLDECTCSDPAVRERHERAWENSRDFDPTKRWSPKSATPQLRQQVGDRDGWVCHRCGMAIDQTLNWPHPLAPTADHHPITRSEGGPTIACNLKIAHSLCNGSTHSPLEFDLTDEQRRMIDVIQGLPRDRIFGLPQRSS